METESQRGRVTYQGRRAEKLRHEPRWSDSRAPDLNHDSVFPGALVPLLRRNPDFYEFKEIFNACLKNNYFRKFNLSLCSLVPASICDMGLPEQYPSLLCTRLAKPPFSLPQFLSPSSSDVTSLVYVRAHPHPHTSGCPCERGRGPAVKPSREVPAVRPHSQGSGFAC